MALSVGLTRPKDVARLAKMLAKVQHHLGAHPGAIQAIDNAPRAPDYVTEFRMLKRHTDALTGALQSANARILESLDLNSLEAARTGVAALGADLATMIAAYSAAKADRGGRPKQQALGLLIHSLRKIFKAYYRRGTKSSTAESDTTKRLAKQKAERQFLGAALTDIKIDARKLGKRMIAHRQGKKPPK